MPDETVPIRVTYKNTHINDKDEKFQYVELQTGNPNYHRHSNTKNIQDWDFLKENIKYKTENIVRKRLMPKKDILMSVNTNSSYKYINQYSQNHGTDRLKSTPSTKNDKNKQNIKTVLNVHEKNETTHWYEKIEPQNIIEPGKTMKKQHDKKLCDLKNNLNIKWNLINCLGTNADVLSETKFVKNISAEIYVDSKSPNLEFDNPTKNALDTSVFKIKDNTNTTEIKGLTDSKFTTNIKTGNLTNLVTKNFSDTNNLINFKISDVLEKDILAETTSKYNNITTNGDKLVEKIAEHYKQLLPWVNYKLNEP
uniref:Uncharacterized protein n=1 Tax=Clastoptera arizonana TaxID=38151 RepID=A0A1B6C7M2_9HEMI